MSELAQKEKSHEVYVQYNNACVIAGVWPLWIAREFHPIYLRM
jgi:hypothetical protein